MANTSIKRCAIYTASPQKKGWSKITTRSTHSAGPVRHSSGARRVKGGG